MNHTFDVAVATRYGVDAAIMIENFRFWIAKNKANGRHFYEGRFWTYNSIKAFSELFPYWTEKQIRRILDKLEDAEVLVSGSFNASPWDKTKWYAFGERFDLPEQAARFAQTSRTLDTDSKQDTPPNPQGGKEASPPGFELFWLTWPKSQRKGGKAQCLSVWKKSKLEPEAGRICAHVQAMIHSADWTKNGGEFIPAPVVYLRGNRWDGAEVVIPVQKKPWDGAL